MTSKDSESTLAGGWTGHNPPQPERLPSSLRNATQLLLWMDGNIELPLDKLEELAVWWRLQGCVMQGMIQHERDEKRSEECRDGAE